MYNIVIRLLAKFLITIHVIKKMVIVRIDGGICSQMHFYLIGRYFSEKGIIVKYDLSWFKKYGKDLNGQNVRNFDLLKAFPYLEFEVAKKWELIFYRRLGYNNTIYLSAVPPIYLGGYYEDNSDMYTKYFPRYFHCSKDILDSNSKVLYKEILHKKDTIAIHVRRGDLANYNGAYGNPVDKDYFAKAIEYISELCNNAYFYLFSDDTQWVKEQLIGNLPIKDNYMIVNINGSDKGYMDLFLISVCKHQICSKGSLGKYGGFLAKDSNGKIFVFDDEVERRNWESKHPKIFFIS